MRKSFQCQMLVKAICAMTFFCLGCGSAKSDEPTPTESGIVLPVAKTAFVHKARPYYITPSLHEKWVTAKLEQRMRRTTNAEDRVFFMTKKEIDRKETFSVQDTRDGFMVNGQALPVPSLYMRQLPVPYERGIAYATPEFMHLLDIVSRKMKKRFPDTILYLGNLGLQGGGDIPYSVSHNAGRDGDIGYYLKDENGKFAHPDHLHHINRRFVSKEDGAKYTFDLQKNAALIEELLMQKEVPLQFVFVARHLRTALRHELAQRENPDELLARFDAVVMELASHDDHFHIRVYCSNDDICAGCLDKSVIHEWIEDPVPKQEACITKHYKTLSSKKAGSDERAAALQRLALMNAATRNTAPVIKALSDDDESVRAAAAIAAASIRASAHKALAHRLDVETSPVVQRALLDAIAANDSDETAEAMDRLLQRFNNGTVPFEPGVFNQVIRHIVHNPRRVYTPTLIAALKNEALAAQAPDVLLAVQVVTNHIYNVSAKPAAEPVPAPDAAEFALIAADLETWFAQNESRSRTQWLMDGFKKAGFKVTTLQIVDVPLLLDAIDAPNLAISFNAQLTLKLLAHLEQDSLDWSIADARWHYTRYFKRRAKKYKLNLDDRDEHGNKL